MIKCEGACIYEMWVWEDKTDFLIFQISKYLLKLAASINLLRWINLTEVQATCVLEFCMLFASFVLHNLSEATLQRAPKSVCGTNGMMCYYAQKPLFTWSNFSYIVKIFRRNRKSRKIRKRNQWLNLVLIQ